MHIITEAKNNEQNFAEKFRAAQEFLDSETLMSSVKAAFEN